MTDKTHSAIDRRTVLKTIAGVGTVSVAGCSGSSNAPGSTDGDAGENTSGSGLIQGWEVDGVDLVVELQDPGKVSDFKLRGPNGEYKDFAAGGPDNTNDDYATSMFEQSHDVTGERTRLPLVQTNQGDAAYDYSRTTYEPGPQTIVAVDDSGEVLEEVTTDPIQPDIEITDIGFTDDTNRTVTYRPDNLEPYIEITNNGSGPTYIRAVFQDYQRSENVGVNIEVNENESGINSIWVKTGLAPGETTTELVSVMSTRCTSGGTRTVPIGVYTVHGTVAVDVEKTFEVMEVESGTWTTEQCVVQSANISSGTYQFQEEVPLPSDID